MVIAGQRKSPGCEDAGAEIAIGEVGGRVPYRDYFKHAVVGLMDQCAL